MTAIITTLNQTQIYTFYIISLWPSPETEQSFGFTTWWTTPLDTVELHWLKSTSLHQPWTWPRNRCCISGLQSRV